MLGFNRDELGLDLAVSDVLGEGLHYVGLRRDGIGRHHVRVDLLHGHSHGLVAGDGEYLALPGHHSSPLNSVSGCMLMASAGHSVAQMPQPLQ